MLNSSAHLSVRMPIFDLKLRHRPHDRDHRLRDVAEHDRSVSHTLFVRVTFLVYDSAKSIKPTPVVSAVITPHTSRNLCCKLWMCQHGMTSTATATVLQVANWLAHMFGIDLIILDVIVICAWIVKTELWVDQVMVSAGVHILTLKRGWRVEVCV